MFKVLTLGPVAIHHIDGGTPIELQGARSREVIAAIATGAGAPVPRPKLWRWLWPDLPRAQARKALNTEIWRLRKSVRQVGYDPDALIASSVQDVRLCTDAGARCDLMDFRTRLSAVETLDEMMQLARSYRGEFAEGLSAEWMEDIRRELRSAFLGLLQRSISKALESDQVAEARFLAEKLNAEEPYDETAVRALMRVAQATGDRGGATQTFQRFADRLQSDLDVMPTERTLAVYRECRGDAPSGPSSPELPGYRIEPAPAETLAVADARRKLLAIADLVTAIRRDLRDIAHDLETVDR